jgi:glycosyltransferase involved in cell wall biosynthesis
MEASIVIGYHNEAGLVQLLLESIVPEIRERVEIILVDDASTETYEYEYEGHIRSFRNKERKGIGACFDLGVNVSSGSNIILCGGDIVFKGDDWLDCFLEDLDDDNAAIYCSVCLNLHEHALSVDDEGIVKGYGAYIETFVEETTIFRTKWLAETLKDESVYQVPCILGACYAVTKEHYNFIRGFKGHLYWGCLEPYVSIKNWMLGGRNKIDTRVETGHWFISKGDRFTVESWQVAYNKLLTTLVLGGDLRDKLFDYLNYIVGIDIAVKYVIEERKKEIEELRSYVEGHQVRSLSQFIAWQDSLIFKQGRSQ